MQTKSTLYTCKHVDDLEAVLEVSDDGVGGHIGAVGVVIVAVVVAGGHVRTLAGGR